MKLEWNQLLQNNAAQVTAFAGIIGALFAYIVNSIGAFLARRREKALKAIEQLLAFESDPGVQAALHVLDYPGASKVLAGALKPHFRVDETGFKVDEAFSEKEAEVRNNFDVLLSRLELIEGLIQHGVIDKKEFGDQFRYWLELCGERADPHDRLNHLDNAARRALWIYIRNYEFKDVVRLFRRYHRASAVRLHGDKGMVYR